MSNTQHKLDKARPPRVQITYDVDIGDAQAVKELPLVIGVMGDFTNSHNTLRERKFINIDKDNFAEIMSSMKPESEFLVESTLPDHTGNLAISLAFNSIDDFSPDSIARQVEPLRNLIELREQLCDLRNRAASNERLKEQLSELLQQHNFAPSSESKNPGEDE
ncbi:type VI secretion system contractile sheath small subunit [Escherichia coli]|uniref:type VI secretion system contractile sheath small subunit n=1 Tax=Citrobacter TaxID=544 RepID=UPI000CDE27B9|nr:MULTISPECIES: type VI secretion system contractile sheath small subunit [Citrobacter]ELK6843032.1 type VI secretion system contractile sheath small subunit [Citrobacter braakii]MBJ9573347.1 type VI secretion system contractile sheath small subunit [Citrobacter braakii]POT29247.1 type VI secretion system contractile sheath small subunit [Citrobacter braakii]POT34106.1 type VI secretion system contractile sheath small subunit [Citrobacter braakii]POT38931.1 type VI secretion system contractil